ncbi:MAG: hypothetical protein QF503_02760 [Rhodospirillales bacterium]|nr:hypothetical protein [Rhodospirillales bacterium]
METDMSEMVKTTVTNTLPYLMITLSDQLPTGKLNSKLFVFYNLDEIYSFTKAE